MAKRPFQATRRSMMSRIIRGGVHEVMATHPLQQRLASLETAAFSTKYARVASFQQRAIDFLRSFSPRDPDGRTFVRLGGDADGGYVHVAEHLAGTFAYSLGVGENVSWDKAISDIGYRVIQYDHTVDMPPEPIPNSTFHKKMIVGRGAENDIDRTSVDKEVELQDLEGTKDNILKVDIEGGEWDVLETILDDTITKFTQVIVEYHWLDRIITSNEFERHLNLTRKINSMFTSVHVHANNELDFSIVGGVAVPPVLEVTYLRNDVCGFSPCSRTFPTSIDRPNNVMYPELCLGSFQY